MINRKFFFASIKNQGLTSVLKQKQIEGFDAIFNYWELDLNNTDLRHLAYMLATAWHETAYTMQPISEYAAKDSNNNNVPDNFEKYDTMKQLGNTPAKDNDGALYKGRGYVQLTGKRNYEIFQSILGMPLVAQPELARKPEVAAIIMFEGMKRGLFTGKKLSQYINTKNCDYVNARRIINGTDKAVQIAEHAKKFAIALSA